MNNKISLLFLALTTFVYTSAFITVQANETNKRSIESVMNHAMKGSNSLHRKVSLGQGSDADAQALLDYFKSLPSEHPPQGDAESWSIKTASLIAAAQSVVDKKPNATTELQMAGNCKACHSVHKGN